MQNKKFDPIKVLKDRITAIARRQEVDFEDLLGTVLRKAKVDASTWWRWENGKSSPLVHSIERVDKVLCKMETLEKMAVAK